MEKFNLRYLKPGAFIIACAVLALTLFIANKYLTSHWSISFSIFAALSGIFAFINIYLWNIKPFCWLYAVPDFSGRYTGQLTYEYRNENGVMVSDTLDHIKVVRQNGSDITINSWTKTKEKKSTESKSIEASIVKENDGTFKIIYNYINEGNSGFAPHYGTEVLKVIENGEGKYLKGKYYTERLPFQTKGTIDLKYINKNYSHEK